MRVLIVDDHTLFRQGLRRMLDEEQDIDVIGEATSSAEALAAIEQLHPDVVTIDIRLGGVDGIQATRQILQRNPATRVIILTTYEDEQYVRGALQAGAFAYLLKNASYDTLANAIRAVGRGQRMLAPELVHLVLGQYYHMAREQSEREVGLSEQEIEVLRLLAEGTTSKDIAERLFMSEISVKRKIQDIVDKLHAANRVQAVAEAVRRGLI